MNAKQEYSEFLKSPFWIHLRTQKLMEHPRCERCGGMNGPMNAHHVHYRHPWTETLLEDLMTLCRECHKYVHGVKELLDLEKATHAPEMKNGCAVVIKDGMTVKIRYVQPMTEVQLRKFHKFPKNRIPKSKNGREQVKQRKKWLREMRFKKQRGGWSF